MKIVFLSLSLLSTFMHRRYLFSIIGLIIHLCFRKPVAMDNQNVSMTSKNLQDFPPEGSNKSLICPLLCDNFSMVLMNIFFSLLVLEVIFSWLPPKDIASVSQTCQKFNEITKGDQLWAKICFNQYKINVPAAKGFARRIYKNGTSTHINCLNSIVPLSLKCTILLQFCTAMENCSAFGLYKLSMMVVCYKSWFVFSINSCSLYLCCTSKIFSSQ